MRTQRILLQKLFVAFVPPVCRQAGSWRNKLRSNQSVIICVTCLPTGRSVAYLLTQRTRSFFYHRVTRRIFVRFLTTADIAKFAINIFSYYLSAGRHVRVISGKKLHGNRGQKKGDNLKRSSPWIYY